MEYQGLTLDPFQEQAMRLVEQKRSFIISAPTGSGKTVIAEYAIEVALKEKQEIIYTAPIKALSNQKFRDFTRRYGKDKVGIMTGDVTYNAGSPVIIMTTEIFRNAVFEDPERFNHVLYLVLDEVHYMDDAERGSVWEESIIFAPPHIKIMCLSATVPNVSELSRWIAKTRGDDVDVVSETKRSVPLHELCFMNGRGLIPAKQACQLLPKKIKSSSRSWEEDEETHRKSLEQVVEYLKSDQKTPSLYFLFSRKDCESCALRCRTQNLLNKEEGERVVQRLSQLASLYKLRCNPNDYGLGSLLCRGIGYHHAGMIPALKEVVEQLFTEGLIKLLFATETFALGVNMPAKSVVFSALKKYDGNFVRYLKAIEYQQMSGRAGRRGMDAAGYVYADLVGEQISSGELTRIIYGPLEPIKSQFNLSYSTILSLYQRLGDELIRVYDRSFGAFQKANTLEGKKKKKPYAEQKESAKKKLALLTTLGYIQNKTLTSKGRFAKLINGYEIQLTELFFGGLLEGKSEVVLFVTLVSIIFDSKKDTKLKLPKDIRLWTKPIEKCIHSIKSVEAMYGLKDEIKMPDFTLAKVAQAWAMGKPFHELGKYSSVSPGDIIRNFRQAIQLCRQLRKACEGYESFVTVLERCLQVVNRDEVNAFKQLEAFTSIE